MNVTVVLPFVNLTGGIRVMLDYACALEAAGHRVTAVYPSWPYRFQWTRAQQWVEFRKHRHTGNRVPWFPRHGQVRCVPLVAAPWCPRADIVVATAWPTVHSVARLPSWCGRKIHVVMHHESGTGPDRRVRAIYSYRCFTRVAFSQFVRDTVEQRFGCLVDQVVPNGVDERLFFPEGTPEPATVLWLYHPDPRKGAPDALEALSTLRLWLPGVTVRVCGTVRPPSLPDWMEFTFHPSDETLRRFYSTATTLLYPSRYEGFGLPPLEAMACGCPPVTTNVGAVPEYAVHGRNALIVAPGDVRGMVEQLHRVLTHPRLRRRLADAGVETARRYRLSAVAPLFVSWLEALGSD